MVYYDNKATEASGGEEPAVALDTDAREGFGPETITIRGIKAKSKFSCWVRNCDDSKAYQGAVVDVFNHAGKIVSVNSSDAAKAGGGAEKVMWSVLAIAGSEYLAKQDGTGISVENQWVPDPDVE